MEQRSIQVKKYIESVDDVREFFADLIVEGLAIHPEDTFDQCAKPEWGISDAMINRLDSILNDCHDVCDKADVDICEVAIEANKYYFTNLVLAKITRIGEAEGWKVDVDFTSTPNLLEVTFYKNTSYGQDFTFEAELKDADYDAFCDNVYAYWESYDPDEEAMLWAGPDGHGKNGAPYRLADIVKDMEEAEQMVEDLYNALSKER